MPAGVNVWQPPQPADANAALPATGSPLAIVGAFGSVPSITVIAVGATVFSVGLPQPAASTTMPASTSSSNGATGDARRRVYWTVRLPACGNALPRDERRAAERAEAEHVGGRVVDEQREGDPDQEGVDGGEAAAGAAPITTSAPAEDGADHDLVPGGGGGRPTETLPACVPSR